MLLHSRSTLSLLKYLSLKNVSSHWICSHMQGLQQMSGRERRGLLSCPYLLWGVGMWNFHSTQGEVVNQALLSAWINWGGKIRSRTMFSFRIMNNVAFVYILLRGANVYSVLNFYLTCCLLCFLNCNNMSSFTLKWFKTTEFIFESKCVFLLQVARLAECERMAVAIELSNWLNDASYTLQSVVQCYGLLAPIIYHKISSVPVVQVRAF